jgi:hypothetical protein
VLDGKGHQHETGPASSALLSQLTGVLLTVMLFLTDGILLFLTELHFLHCNFCPERKLLLPTGVPSPTGHLCTQAIFAAKGDPARRAAQDASAAMHVEPTIIFRALSCANVVFASATLQKVAAR